MTDSKNIKIEDYIYPLPDDRIAKYPLAQRELSKLLVYKGGSIADTQFKNVSDFLDKDTLLVFNNTKVIQARILMQKETGAKIEIFCLEPHSPLDYEQNFASTANCRWVCIVGNLKKWKDQNLSLRFSVGAKKIVFVAQKIESKGQNHIIEFSWNDDSVCFADILKEIGNIPIPPYLNRNAEDSDTERYQTIYSKYEGSVAAPTAGLHFSAKIIQDLRNKGITTDEVTLHVGAGTFKPVKTEYVADHEMHVETIVVNIETIKNLINSIDSVIAVGTTSVRTLETLYWLGVKCVDSAKLLTEYEINQWEPYNLPQHVSAFDALTALYKNMKNAGQEMLYGKTQIIIIPGYESRLVKGIITNFHQPASTLLLLISSFVGENWRKIYDHALQNEYRFLSYGDSSLLYKDIQ